MFIENIINENNEVLIIKFSNLSDYVKIKIIEQNSIDCLDVDIYYEESMESEKEIIKKNVEHLIYSTLNEIVENSLQVLGCENVSN